MKISYALIGVQKCGTSSVHSSISKHPDIIAPYGLKDKILINDLLEINHEIDNPHNKKVFASNVTYCHDLEQLNQLHKHNKDIYIILILRDPIERVVSAYRYAFERGIINLSLHELLLNENPNKFNYKEKFLNNQLNLILQTKYGKILNNVLMKFNESNIIVCDYECLKINSDKFYNELLTFLKLKSFKITSKKVNVTKGGARFQLLNKIIFNKSYKYSSIRSLLKFIIPKNSLKKVRDMVRKFNQKEKRFKATEEEINLIHQLLLDDQVLLEKTLNNFNLKKIGFKKK